jgi:hypothetical protein
MTTFFAAPLTCPHCGKTAPDDTSTRMQSRLINEPGVHVLRVGDVVPEFQSEIDLNFIRLRPLPDRGPLILLQEWTCPNCNSRCFAHVTFDQNGRIIGISAVPLTRATLDAAHLAYEDLSTLYEDLVGEPFYVDGKIRPDFLARLRARLPG